MAKRLHIDAIQTAPPAKVTPPDQARPVFISLPPATVAVVAQTRFQVVLYYNPAGPEESPLTVAARVKESLSAALPERPVLSGRLRKLEEEASGGGRWEVKFNDAGVRLVQATAEVTMADVIESKAAAHEVQAHLAYWDAVDIDRPDFSALFYIQVTQFEGDGYSIGVSCSLLLADPSFLTKFLMSWAEIHAQMLAPATLLESPMFHLSYFQRPDRPNRLRSIELALSDSNRRHPSSNATMLFELRDRRDSAQSYDAMAIACLREATARLEARRPVSEFILIVSDHVGDLTVKKTLANSSSTAVLSDDVAYDVARWDQHGMEELTLVPGHKPVHVSSQIIFDGKDDGLVVIMIPESDARLVISVTLPYV